MIKAPISLQDLRRSLYIKAKAEPAWRFWGLYVHVCKTETLYEAYQMAKRNDGAPGIDGVTFEAIEESGVEGFLKQIQGELVTNTYRPMQARKKEIAKDGGNKIRVLSIPAIRDRVVQGRSSSSWSRSSKPTSNRDRTDTDRNEQLIKR
jgi:RNA-directed DNA polymerase